jgi:O-antigen biosynthesis protein WbqP
LGCQFSVLRLIIGIMIYRIFKRLFDFVCALIGIIGTSPIWILSIIVTEISDSGPLFYFANRVGKDNKRFKMWKFRSMRVAKGANENSLRPDQDRIFWWGNIMRRLKIDELPQLINILTGTMSIVGPRPAAIDQVDITRGGANAIAATVPCGLTSQSSLWDYIYGDQFPDEEEYNEKVLPIRLKLDVYYVKQANFFGDIKLIIWTVIAILYTACGKYPLWMHSKLVEYSKTV